MVQLNSPAAPVKQAFNRLHPTSGPDRSIVIGRSTPSRIRLSHKRCGERPVRSWLQPCSIAGGNVHIARPTTTRL